MKIVVAEGTPEELARYEQLTSWTQTAEMGLPEDSGGDGVDGDIYDFLMGRAGTKKRFETAKAFVGKALVRGDIVAEPGTSKDSRDGYGNYLRLYRTGPRRTGAVAYFTPSSGVVDVRLPKESAEARANVQVRYPDRDDEYNIRVRIDSSESVDLAIELLDEAIKQIEE